MQIMGVYTYKWLTNEHVWAIYLNGDRVYKNEYIRDREDLLIFFENKISPCIIYLESEE